MRMGAYGAEYTWLVGRVVMGAGTGGGLPGKCYGNNNAAMYRRYSWWDQCSSFESDKSIRFNVSSIVLMHCRTM
jgi:hypothetical protein